VYVLSDIIVSMRDSAAGVKAAAPAERSGRAAPRVIAVDGSAASGKSTVGRKLAEKLGYPFLDTGLMYRAVTLAALDRGIDAGDQGALADLAGQLRLEVGPPQPGSSETCSITIDNVDVTSQLRREDVEDAVSLVSRVGGVREALVRQQREIAGRQPMVMAGRDIGTVVLPDADLKVYLDASIGERARRRHAEFSNRGRSVTRDIVLEDLRRRDQIDSERAVSPLRPAGDAVVIGTDGLTQEEVLEKVLKLVDGAR
jgi:cytidylate kinase